MSESLHLPVMLNEVLEMAKMVPQVHKICDATFGRGGHTRMLLSEFPSAQVVAIDQDDTAIKFGRENFSSEIQAGRLEIIKKNFSEISWVNEFDFVLADLGVSSPQLDEKERGFSFNYDGPLDMRMDHSQAFNAKNIIMEYDEEELIRVFKEQGEVRSPFRVVRAIVHDRKTKEFNSTKDLAEMIARIDGWRKKGQHPATLYFMALRLEVNQELERLTAALPKMIDSLKDQGVLAIITFHSLEDRIVKNHFKSQLEIGRLINKKVIVPSDDEIKSNARSRSAKLRGFSKSKGSYQ